MRIIDQQAAGRRFVSGFVHAWVHQATATLGEIFTDDVCMYWHPERDPIIGLIDLAAYWDDEGDLQSEIRVTARDPIVAATTVVAELWVQMMYRGTDASNVGAIAAVHEAGTTQTARPVTGQLCVVAELAPDGRCRMLRQYQLGGDGDVEPPEWWVERAM